MELNYNIHKSNEIKRLNKNALFFIIAFALMGGIHAITDGVFRTYIKCINPNISDHFSLYAGMSVIILAFFILFTVKSGYKKILILFELLLLFSFITAIFIPSPIILRLDIICSQLSTKAFDFFIMLVLVSYTSNIKDRLSKFTKAIFLYALVDFIATLFNGKILIFIFKEFIHIPYSQANTLSEHTNNFTSFELNSYLFSCKLVIFIAILLTIISIIYLLFIDEKITDFKEIKNVKLNKSINIKIFKDKYIFIWILYCTIMAINSTLLNPNWTVYFNSYLHIPRGTVSTILAMKTLGEIIMLLFTTFLIKKLGYIKLLVLNLIICCPLMIIIGMGRYIGPTTVIIMGVCLFFRYGLTKINHPLEDTIQLSLVKKDDRAIFIAFIAFLDGIFSILIGILGSKLFTTLVGYQIVFFTFAMLFVVFAIIIHILFKDKFKDIK